MNKYEQFRKSGVLDTTAHSVLSSMEREQMEAARMHKPGYRRKMRRTKGKHAKHTSR